MKFPLGQQPVTSGKVPFAHDALWTSLNLSQSSPSVIKLLSRWSGEQQHFLTLGSTLYFIQSPAHFLKHTENLSLQLSA